MRVETIVVGDFAVNCYLVAGPTHAFVIDPGAEPEEIADALQRFRLPVGGYLLTHGHIDHISGLAALVRRYPAPVTIHARDHSWAFAETNQLLPHYPVPEQPQTAFREIEEGMDPTDGELQARTMVVPGHTPGSVCFYFEKAKVAFTGDTLFAGSVGRTDLPGGNSRQLTASLAKLAALPDDTVVYPGHGPRTTIGEEKRTNYFLSQF